MSFEEIFESYCNSYRRYITIPDDENPTLGEFRGKIVFFQNFSSKKKYGLDYRDFFYIQDKYHLSSNWDLYAKWSAVKKHFDDAEKNTSTKFGYINYLSGSGASFSYFVASAHISRETDTSRLATGFTTPGWKNKYPDFPRVNCFIGICTIAFEGTNTLSYNYILKNKPNYVGVVMADFPGPGLIDAIIQVNLKQCKTWTWNERAVIGDIYIYHNPYTKTVDYFKSKVDTTYGYFPIYQSSNYYWEYIGQTRSCREW